MLLTITFPIVDTRRFYPDAAALCLTRPTWPMASPGREFVRGYGRIAVRRKGGAPGWPHEQHICEAKNALIFDRLGRKHELPHGGTATLYCAFKRFFFDGTAVAKFDIGLALKGGEPAVRTQKDVKKTATSILEVQTIVPAGRRALISSLGDAGAHLAESYFYSSMPTRSKNDPPEHLKPEELVISGAPCVVLERQRNGRTTRNTQGKGLAEHGLHLHHEWLLFRHGIIDLWCIESEKKSNFMLARDLRVSLNRLHAEREVLRLILNAIAQRKIFPRPRSPESDLLQRYLLNSLRTLRGLRNNLQADAPQILAAEADSLVHKGSSDGLLSALEQQVSALDFRPNVARSVIEAAQNNFFILNRTEVTMGDSYNPTFNNSQTGANAFGPQAHAQGTVNQGAPGPTTVSQDQYKKAIGTVQAALVRDQDALDSIDGKLHDALHQFLRIAREIQVDQKSLAEVQAKMKETLDEVWAKEMAKGLRSETLPKALEVAGALLQSPVFGTVAEALIRS